MATMIRAHVQQDRGPPGVEQPEAVDHLEGGHLRRHGGHQRGDQEESHDELLEAELEAVDRVRGHRADDHRAGDGEQQDEGRVAESLQHVAVIERRGVVREVEPVVRQGQRALAVGDLLVGLQRGQEDHGERQQHHE
ncbi:hypothetical protein ACVILE_000451 [Streptomyces sp. M18.1]